jgi:hypothetical protein
MVREAVHQARDSYVEKDAIARHNDLLGSNDEVILPQV